MPTRILSFLIATAPEQVFSAIQKSYRVHLSQKVT